MSAPLVLPFNFDSGTTTRKTTSYTVGSGKYCYATPLEVSCTVNSSTVFLGNSVRGGTVSGAGIYYLGPDNFTGLLQHTGGGTTLTIGKLNTSGALYAITTVSGTTACYITNGVPSGTQADAAISVATSPGLYFSTTGSVAFIINPGFLYSTWYKAGDVLTGGYWLVTEYNSVT